MTRSKKQGQTKATEGATRAQVTELEFREAASSAGLSPSEAAAVRSQVEVTPEPWSKWKVRPDLVPMLATPPESGIGKRIKYCCGQLDNLPVEALARYTRNFEEGGVSRQSLVRYVSGDTSPGARELRILCEALWVPANWLLLGVIDPAAEGSALMEIARGLRRMMREESGGEIAWLDRMEKQTRDQEIEKRQKWIEEARKPQPRS